MEAGTGCCTKVNCCAQATGSSLPRRSVRPGSCYLLCCCCASEFWLVTCDCSTRNYQQPGPGTATGSASLHPATPWGSTDRNKRAKATTYRQACFGSFDGTSLVREPSAAFEWGLPDRLTDNHVSLTHRSLHYNGQYYRLRVVSDRLVTYYLGLSPCQSDLTVIWHAISVNTRVGVVQSSPVHLIPTSSASLRTIRPPSSTIAMQGMRCLPKSSRWCQCYQV